MNENWFSYIIRDNTIIFTNLSNIPLKVNYRILKDGIEEKKGIVEDNLIFYFTEENIYEFTIYGKDIKKVVIPYFNHLLKDLIDDYIKILCGDKNCKCCNPGNDDRVLIKTGYYFLTTGICLKKEINQPIFLSSYNKLKNIINEEFILGKFNEKIYKKDLIQLFYLVLRNKYSKILDKDNLEKIFQYKKVSNCLNIINNCNINTCKNNNLIEKDFKEIIYSDMKVLEPYHFPYESDDIVEIKYIKIIDFKGVLKLNNNIVYKGQVINFEDIKNKKLTIEKEELNQDNMIYFEWKIIKD